ncbi:MAG: sulfotransferase domain-containing protein [Bacteroidetes bacterium]|nr:sulfotransferase domain-containing protein [Bacteroidota bacterium]
MFNTLRNIFQPKLPHKKILLYGLQRSGTNYLETLIHLNYPNCQFINGEIRNEIIHKHFRLYDNKNCIPEPQFENTAHFNSLADFEQALPENNIPDIYLVMSKDPYSWYTSYVGWSKKNNWPKRDYHYIEEYNLFYGKWKFLASGEKRILFIRYQDLLTAPQTELNKLATALSLPIKQPIRTTKKVYASRRFTDDKKDAFLNKSYLGKIDAGDFTTINTLLDVDLLNQLGYSIEQRS